MDGLQQPPGPPPAGAPTPPPKKLKTGHPADFSGSVRDKIQGSRRTGQACDRCKVRPLPEFLARHCFAPLSGIH